MRTYTSRPRGRDESRARAPRARTRFVPLSAHASGAAMTSRKSWLVVALQALQFAHGNIVDGGELVANPSFAGMKHWTVHCPNPAICPRFAPSTEPGALDVQGSNERCYGWAEGDITEPLELDTSYCLSASVRWHGIADPNRHIEISIFSASNWNEGIDGSWTNGTDGWASATRRFTFATWTGGGGDEPKPNDPAKIRLYFRFTGAGSATFRNISLVRCNPPARRVVRVAAADGRGQNWTDWLDEAGRQKVDFAVLPELFNGQSDPMSGAENLTFSQNGSSLLASGPAAKLMQTKAREWKMHVSGTFYGREGDIVYNIALLFGRAGELVGVHRKNEVYEPEEDLGASPGMDGFPVFDTDVGKVGMITCYESWFPDTIRILVRNEMYTSNCFNVFDASLCAGSSRRRPRAVQF